MKGFENYYFALQEPFRLLAWVLNTYHEPFVGKLHHLLMLTVIINFINKNKLRDFWSSSDLDLIFGLVVGVLGYTSTGPGFDSRALSDLLRSIGPATVSTRPREDN
jgi:hypothetical protein